MHRRPSTPPLTAPWLRDIVAQLLSVPPAEIDDQANVFELGLESIAIMRIANLCRRAGAKVKFSALAQSATIEQWTALLAEQAGRTPAARRPAPPPPGALHPDATFPLAPMQQAYWIGRLDGQPLGGVSAHFYAEFDGGGVDPQRLETACRALFARHDMLRARFLPSGRQQVLRETPWRGLTVHDLRGHAGAALTDLRTRLAHRRFDIEAGEVFDVQLSLLDGGRTRVHVGIDMLVADAQSYQIILAELASLYRDPQAALEPLGYSFARYLTEDDDPEASAEAQAYWLDRLDGLPGPPPLPIVPEAVTRVHAGVDRRFREVPAARREDLARTARAHGLTLASTLCALFAEVLGRWSAEPRFLLNLPTFDRREHNDDIARLVGDFTNVTLLSVDTAGQLSFAGRAGAIQAQLRSDLAHARYSGVSVLRDLGRRNPGTWLRAPVVYTSVIGMGELFGDEVRACFGEPVWTSSETPQVWLDHQVIEGTGGGLLINWDVARGVFPDGLVDDVFAAHGAALEWLSEHDDWRAPLPLPLPAAQVAVRERVNDTGDETPGGLLHDAFFARARREPDRLALAWGTADSMTYGELAGTALRVAGLLRANGVRPGDPVAITVGRGPGQIAAVLGVLAAGGVYVPVGCDQPARRRDRIYANAGVRCVLVSDARPGGQTWPGGPAILDVAGPAVPAPAPVPVSPDDLAYVIYTSGSTGEPKGVEITHRAALNTVTAVNERFGIGVDDRVLAVSALDFDLSVYDIFGLLSAGGSVVLVEERDRKEARAWALAARRWGVTVWNSVPALLEMYLYAAEGVDEPVLPRLALVSGDWVAVDLPARLRALRADARFVALGGATEAAIWSNLLEVGEVDPGWRAIPYGFPLPRQRFRVVDDRGRDCPAWVPGELWIGGAGVAQGYRNDPVRTSAAFVTDERGRWYRTGDRGRYLPDGMLEFLGRTDAQVKIRGNRIELGEVAAALRRHPGVTDAVVLAAGEKHDRLAAAVTGEPDGGGEALRRTAAELLPPYMVPDTVALLTRFPLTGNGKVDRRQLAAQLRREDAGEPAEAPRTPTERALAELWESHLSRPVTRRDTFFDLGGDSLTATRVLEAVRKRFGVVVPLQQLFSAPTVVDLAAAVDSGRSGSGDTEEGEI
jgi:amino acid adenylation domain-containing protein